jgi:hypothetical protein
MSCFRKAWRSCTSKKEKKAAASNKTSKRESSIGKGASENSSTKPSSSIENASSEVKKPEAESCDWPLRNNSATFPTSLGIDLSTGFGAADRSVMEDKSVELTGTGAPGSHSALFGLTPDGHKESETDYSSNKPKPTQPDGHKETEADYSSSKPKPANSAEDSKDSSGDAPADLVTASSGHDGMSVPSADDGTSGGEFATGWAAANTSVATDAISSACNGSSGDAGADSGAAGASGGDAGASGGDAGASGGDAGASSDDASGCA